MTSNLMWKLFATTATLVAGYAARDLTRAGWRSVKQKDPPLNPASHKTTWKEALLWTMFSSLIVGLARLFTRRGAASVWKSRTGRFPRQR